MTDRPWEFDIAPSATPPVRPRSVAPTAPSFDQNAGAPPAPPAPPDPFGGAAGGPSLWNQQGTGHVGGPGAWGAASAAPVSVPAVAGLNGEQAVASGPPAARSRFGWRTLAAFVAGGALTAVGFGVGVNVNSDTEIAAAPASTTPASTGSITVSPPDLDTTEPAAFVASLLGPSVVQIETNRGLGSGVVFDDGLIMTNNHVIEGATLLRVRLSDGRSLDAELVGTDPRTDIAVLSVGTGHSLVVAELALDGELEVGQYTVAIGSPFELQQTVTSGIVSAVNRPVYNGTGWNAMVQTDAAINPGNSGGALADRQGRVIGINTAIQTDGLSASNAGIGFAMPITTAYDIATRILAGDVLEPGFLGVRGSEESVDELGVEIVEVTPGAAADEAGVQIGDRVLSIDGAPVSSFQELAGLIQTSFPDDEVILEVVRNGEALEIMVILGQK